jgi:DNA-binding GntR family transcriptional regulator
MASATLLTASKHRSEQHSSQSDLAYHLLKEKIVTLQLPPASLLNEADLMADLNLGRTPIREALRQLAFEKLVVILPRRGTLVADLNASDLQKIFELRLELEVTAARLAAQRAEPAQLTAMEALFVDVEPLIQQPDYHQLISLDHQAHILLAQAAHNEFLAEILAQLYTHVLRLWYVSLHKVTRLAEAVAEHQQLIAALKARDAEQAAVIMRAHIVGFQMAFNSL